MATEGRSLGERRGGLATAPKLTREPQIKADSYWPPAEATAAPYLVFEERGNAYDLAKRLFDIVFASLAIVVSLPLIALIALLIKLDSRGPVFFRQERLGRNLRPFTMIKFRSMQVTADHLPPELLKNNESTGPLFKMRKDPRITRVGKLLRRTSLDELPQLFNVLTGSMSIVGPRPPLPRELAGFDQIQRARLQVLPGLTGLWQVSGRSNLPFEEMVRLDLLYVRRRSLRYDLKLLVMTIPCVILGRGAY